ncbi:P-loop containing nucleoside triphosphate hydrolase protein [Mycena pura]|uniref:P-loop containing nucleoside triphosphate hydrolase protein n=1 Tax=Mycena pura TaxID=153505 RepID=A0AAD6VLD8_9AGAR|nr:P-loop containing nucleoside triphosphate hydrolase protein [Mycena pura]
MGAPTENSPDVATAKGPPEDPTKDATPDKSKCRDQALTDEEADACTPLQLGVWRVLLPKEPASKYKRVRSAMDKWSAVALAYPLVLRFLLEIYSLDPRMFILVVVLKLWDGMESVLLLYVSSRLLQIIEVGLREGRPDVNAITQAIIARLICVTFTATTTWAREYISPIFQSRIQRHFEDYLLQAKLRLDIPTSSDSSSKTKASAYDAWSSFEGLCEAAQRAFGLTSQLLFISQQKSGGPLFTTIAVVRPLLALAGSHSLWMKPHVLYSDNEAYLRLLSLESMSGTYYRGDVIAANIAGWITSQYHQAIDALGSVTSRHAWEQYGIERTPASNIISALAGQLPTLYWAINAMLNPATFSMASIAIMQQYSTSLNYALQMLFWDVRQVGKYVTDIKVLYEAAEIQNQIVDGTVEYPRPANEADTSKGMDIELRNVSFAYPGDKAKENALRDVSLRIPAGSLAVIVGANGGGKSTIIKLLARMYDVAPGSGAVVIDGLPIQDYTLASLRQAYALLAQDHRLYPLPLAENIGLGYPEKVDDREMVMQAARDGGAAELLSKFKDGVETNLEPVTTAYGYQLDDDKHKTLKTVLGKLEKTTEVSGGEKQRLVSSRTFMRFQTGKVKLLCVDEPSSALDPKGEFELFERLRAARAGKTLLFVTHRFGHLTKHADIIICMKAGKVAELGTHQELMALDGEYASLYNVQAQAFTAPEVAASG